MFRVGRFTPEGNPSCGYGSLLHMAGSGWLHYMRRGMTDNAVRMDQSIEMEVRLLDGGAEKKGNDTEKSKQQEPAPVRCPILTYSSHH